MKKDGVIVLVGGGTGGHIFPLVAIGEELQGKNVPFVYIGSENSLEQRIITAHRWNFISVNAGKWRRYVSPLSIINNLVDISNIIRGFFQAVRILRKIDAQLVISKGGYVALPVLYAARVVGCPVIVHESDSVMGVANKIGSKFAVKVLTAFDVAVFPNADRRFQKVGIPVRRSLRQSATLRSPKKVRPLILVLPGSQGSTAINQYIKQSLHLILAKYDIVHLTGEKDYSTFVEIKKHLPPDLSTRYKPYSFIDRELPYYYQSADLIIARSSATTAAEAALFSKPLYLIPLPGSANDHQQENAKHLEAAKAAVVRQQYQLSSYQFLSDINKLFGDKDKLTEFGSNLKNYFDSTNSLANIMSIIADAQK
ncbi:MAG: UDP-N-acetylglucosamine--N-acetylmuramyl-(pentapeptide) pyrophosphoryl-undecaprenol N-acetylglucosamine transferase [Patescibacteria group bacterium]